MAVRVGGGAGCALAMLLWAGWGCLRGEAQDAPAIAQTTSEALHAMADLAGSIFGGQVTAVRRRDDAAGVVEIDFAVEDAVRGVAASVYTVREWGGLWRLGAEPFRVGQRYLLLLHAPGPGGLSSPVGGMAGAIPIQGTGPAVGPFVASRPASSTEVSANSAALAETVRSAGGEGAQFRRPYTGVLGPNPPAPTPSDGRVVDLRWVASRVVRASTYPTQPAPRPGPPPGVGAIGHRPFVREETGGVSTAPIGRDTSVATQTAAAVADPATMSYAAVLELLRSWEGESDATR